MVLLYKSDPQLLSATLARLVVPAASVLINSSWLELAREPCLANCSRASCLHGKQKDGDSVGAEPELGVQGGGGDVRPMRGQPGLLPPGGDGRDHLRLQGDQGAVTYYRSHMPFSEPIYVSLLAFRWASLVCLILK
jgi:hypothetical protein